MSVRWGAPAPRRPDGVQRPGPVRSAWLLLATVVCVVLLPSRSWADSTPSPTDSGTTAPATVGSGPTDTATATTTSDPTGTATDTPSPTDTATSTPTGGPTATDAGAVVELDGGQFTALMVAAGLVVAVGSASLVLSMRSGT